MGKIKNPATISSEFGVDVAVLDKLGVVNVLLNTDTLVFIDPLLLKGSAHKEISAGAYQSYRERFEKIIKLLSVSKAVDDVPWRNAKRLFRFSEISWTCLGYGTTVKGSGFGKDLISSTLDTASQIVALGVDDIDLFMALALFEEGIGPDRISDMTTNIILSDLISFSDRVNKTLKIPTKQFKVGTNNYNLVVNPYSDQPLIFVPNDIVRDLPIASDWSDISSVVRENEELRERVNDHVGEIWATMTKKQKQILKKAALRSKEAFQQVMDMIREVEPTPYDFKNDRNGESFWIVLLNQIPRDYPYDLSSYADRKLSADEVVEVVNKILNQFQDLIENKGLWKELWDENGKPRKEKASQRLFFAVAYSYCKANNIDLTPEADSGNGPVDFKLSQGFDSRLVVEVKLSNNGSLVHGYEKQLEIYKKADDTDLGVFLIIDVGGIGKKYGAVQKIRNDFIKEHGKASDIWYVDGNQKASASKRT
ncbi:hypothetical protein [Alteromonas sp.]|uniref:hypothetical protein n=1 Tax=Alteromonas sp. TaxID=232 RepID=UPI000B62861C|nr:hypothetical protein [Alteromonas sp.]MAI36178.1 hypothetical protein [Alteromonas sp.]OUX91766.1 MAG: hypothetical protein CBB95_01250 [Alteromonas sp. TMED35]|tara:strand:+ start:20318 stop:21757 length:1440 start_codon:yes stop_codon:yes gene_type:complete